MWDNNYSVIVLFIFNTNRLQGQQFQQVEEKSHISQRVALHVGTHDAIHYCHFLSSYIFSEHPVCPQQVNLTH